MKYSVLFLSGLSPLALAQSLCDQFSYHSSNGFYLNNNEWGSGSGTGEQCTYINTISDAGVSWQTEWTWSGSENNVKSFPYSGRQLGEKKLVNSIGSIPNAVEWWYEGTNVRANVAYDLFTAADQNHDISSGDYELMIWLGRMDVHPIGSAVGNVNVAGWDWEFFVGYNGVMKVFTFAAPVPINWFDSDIKPFFDHVTSNHEFPADSQHLITLQFGTEPFTGENAKFIVNTWSGNVH